jgi:hypothetical protein
VQDNPPRFYQPVWEQLKKSSNGRIELAALPHFHRRIFKAIGKEKTMDIIYQLQLAELCKKATITRLRDPKRPNVLIISLTLSLGLDDL